MEKVKILLFSAALQLAASFSLQAQKTGSYIVRHDKPQQIIWGLGVEIQNDAIGSGNRGLPDVEVAVPNNLVHSERKRFYKDLMKGFRYCRLAMGLYFRGLDSTRSRIVERYPNQLKDLKEMMDESGMEGISMEYWSPAPFWKSTNSYLGGTLKQSDEAFLNAFGDALCDDIRYLQKNGIHVSMWGLQNEPTLGSVGGLALGPKSQSYSHCTYSPDLYYKAFKLIAPKIRSTIPKALIMVDSWEGNAGENAAIIRKDSALLNYVDSWVYHRIGSNSTDIRKESPKYNMNTFNKPVFQNEFEYQHPSSERLCINTAQNVMNWMTFANSPTWFWLHALKPTYNVEASGYSLGFWRPQDDNDFSHSPQIKKGHWDYNQNNFNALAGFLKYMPWNSQRFSVDEQKILDDNRIMAFKTPKGKLVLVLTNRSGAPFTFNINTGIKRSFTGYRYTPATRNLKLEKIKGAVITPTVPDLSIEFWVEN
ncbi:glycoside hydrolase family 30 beta sandwich domain-containing protein [Desertivirga xinjiangensis]|uniref:glycoside hydrolase family 30 beta sandwich domain-containing protein n=1 Tax=Desertivirga xinjiangensis TaxID=539206 RepID=UPI00210DBDFC|nr:glycoside hydrolase family 30 beta sandwich domain-containing protein [Pedobacter xinjiangensis]